MGFRDNSPPAWGDRVVGDGVLDVPKHRKSAANGLSRTPAPTTSS